MVIEKTKIASINFSKYPLLRIDKGIINGGGDCFDIVYSINEYYPRKCIQEPWFNSIFLPQKDDEQYIYVGIETPSQQSSLDCFIDIFIGTHIIRFALINLKTLPPLPSEHSTTERGGTTASIRSFFYNEKTNKQKIIQPLFDIDVNIIPGLSRVAFKCSSLPATENDELRVVARLKNTNAFLNYQLRLIELSNYRLTLENPPPVLSTSFDLLTGNDSRFFLGPIFFLWFVEHSKRLKYPRHKIENKLSINKLIDKIITNPNLSGTLGEDGHFFLRDNLEGSLFFSRDEKGSMFIVYRKNLVPYKYAKEIFIELFESFLYVSNFLGWEFTTS